MKTNAIIRIIVWSLVIVTLLGILTAGIGIGKILPRKIISSSPLETAIPQQITEPTITQWIEETHVPQRVEVTIPEETDVTLPANYTVTVTTNVRSEPSYTAQVLGAVEAEQVIHPIQGKKINGRHWAYIEAPIQGWVLLVDFEPEETVPADTAPSSAEPTAAPETVPNSGGPIANGFECLASDVSEISIEWAAGNIHILPVEGNRITVEETGDFDRYPMEIKQKNGKLSISYSDQKPYISIGINADFSKDLTIQVPKDFLIRELDIDAGAAVVLVQDLSIREVEFDGASGTCEFVNCTVETLDVDTASGDISFTGTLNALECDAASANFRAVLSNVPRRLEMESMSGNLDVTLPADAGFTVTMEGMNSDFSSDFETTSRNGSHIHRDGACRIQMEALSGDVIIRKGA